MHGCGTTLPCTQRVKKAITFPASPVMLSAVLFVVKPILNGCCKTCCIFSLVDHLKADSCPKLLSTPEDINTMQNTAGTAGDSIAGGKLPPASMNQAADWATSHHSGSNPKWCLSTPPTHWKGLLDCLWCWSMQGAASSVLCVVCAIKRHGQWRPLPVYSNIP